MLSTARSQAVRRERWAAQHAMFRLPKEVFLRQLEGHATKPLWRVEGCPVVILAKLRKGPRHVSSHV
jgi:hypothetical protein